MNKFIITITVMVLLVSTKMLAQDFQGIAVYESKTNLKDMKIESTDMNDELTNKIRERLKKMYEKTYILHFNKYESVYQQEQKLEAPSAGLSMKMSSSSGDGTTYKSVKDKLKIVEEEFFGKEFLVTDSLQTWNWELKDETKKIGDYTCYKAVHVKKITSEDLEEYEKEKKRQESAKTSFFMMNEPEEKITTVWYTPEIPVNQGPDDFWGLPGLIMEASFDNTTILCSKIILNPKKKIEIKKPNKGKRVTKKEYDSLMKKQMEKMTDENGVINIEVH